LRSGSTGISPTISMLSISGPFLGKA